MGADPPPGRLGAAELSVVSAAAAALLSSVVDSAAAAPTVFRQIGHVLCRSNQGMMHAE